ncbi:hypothetical protein Noda2021_07060 [Candidatus Dependentiae bacterium Noda2021]|nr:hypothetical protein Noda2021_07060 [Candidatus Dependentiae bacterium Noda2021]
MKKLLILLLMLTCNTYAMVELSDVTEHDYNLLALHQAKNYVYIPRFIYDALAELSTRQELSKHEMDLLEWLEQGNTLYPLDQTRQIFQNFKQLTSTNQFNLCLSSFAQVLESPDCAVVFQASPDRKKPKIMSNLVSNILSVNGNLIVNGLIITPPVGTLGNSLTQGINGVTGPHGATGAPGVTGNTGADGFTGYTGFTGNVGATGMPGNTGNAGAAGISGINGNTGNSGPRGFTGSTGESGLNGLTGFTGLQGTQGSTGNTGPTSLLVTGPSGVLLGAAASYGVFYTTGLGTGIVQTIPAGSAFTFDGSMPIITPGIVNGGSLLTVVNGGVYKVNYVVQGVTSNVLGLRINGLVDPLLVYAQSSNNSQTVGQAIIRVQPGSTVELVNLNTTSLDVLNSMGGDQIGSAFSLMLQRLS